MSFAKGTGSTVDLFGEILLAADVLHEMELSLEPIDALLFVDEDLLQELAGSVVALLAAETDRVIQALAGFELELEVELMLLHRLFADLDRIQALHVGNTVEQKDPMDDLIGMLHLLDRLLALLRGQLLISPVLAHLRVNEILVDRGELRSEDRVQRLD